MYNIIKGWPSDSALDMSYPADDSLEAYDGVCVTVNANGKVVLATGSDTTPTGFLIGREKMTNACTVLYGAYVLEIDRNHYDDTGTYTPGTKVTVGNEGKLTVSGSSGCCFGRVLSVNAVDGTIRILSGCC